MKEFSLKPVTKEIRIKLDGIEQAIVLKRISGGERNEAYRQATKTNITMNGQANATIDTFMVKELLLTKGIISAPFHTDLAGVKALDHELQDYLYEEFDNLNEVNEKKSQNGENN